MDNSILGIIIGSLATLFGVGLSSLFNHLTKRKELKHNEYLKELELRDREKERKFKVEEKMIEKSIDTHIELFNRTRPIFRLINSYYTADGTLVTSEEEKSKELHALLLELDEWISSKGIFLNRTIKKQTELVITLGVRALKPGARPPVSPKMDVWEQMWKASNGLQDALETISKKYNPFYDLNIKLPEIETP